MSMVVQNDGPSDDGPRDLAAKFAAVRDHTLNRYTAACSDDMLRPDTFASRGYFYEIDSVIGVPWIASKSGEVTNFVGAYSYMNAGGYIRENVLIGRYVSIGRRVTIAAGIHAMRALSTSPSIRGIAARPYDISQAQKVAPAKETRPFTVIESDVWIGDGAVILPGVRLAVGSVVGANAVVTKDTLPYEVVGGIPARFIRRRFDDRVAEALLATCWWEYDRETINQFPCANVFDFIESFGANPPRPARFETFLRP